MAEIVKKFGLDEKSPEEIEQLGKMQVEEYNVVETSQKEIESSLQAMRAQLMENQSVREELGMLDDDSEVFKALGPVLVKLELSDAKATVKQRLDRLESEVARLDEAFKAKEKEKEAQYQVISTIQEYLRQKQVANQAATAE